MNLKITKEEHDRLCSSNYKEYVFGSQLHGIATENSDTDFIRVYDFKEVFKDESIGIFLPNIHSLQYDDVENNSQYVWLTEEQFYRNLLSGDGNMVADVHLLSGRFYRPMRYCRTTNIIKAYLGVSKRDLKMHGYIEKKRFHAYRSLMMAEKLIDNVLPTIQDIIDLKASKLPTTEELIILEKKLREELFELKLPRYPVIPVADTLLTKFYDSNNINEFKY